MLSVGVDALKTQKDLDSLKGGVFTWISRRNSLLYEVEMTTNDFFCYHFMDELDQKYLRI